MSNELDRIRAFCAGDARVNPDSQTAARATLLAEMASTHTRTSTWRRSSRRARASRLRGWIGTGISAAAMTMSVVVAVAVVVIAALAGGRHQSNPGRPGPSPSRQQLIAQLAVLRRPQTATGPVPSRALPVPRSADPENNAQQRAGSSADQIRDRNAVGSQGLHRSTASRERSSAGTRARRDGRPVGPGHGVVAPGVGCHAGGRRWIWPLPGRSPVRWEACRSAAQSCSGRSCQGQVLLRQAEPAPAARQRHHLPGVDHRERPRQRRGRTERPPERKSRLAGLVRRGRAGDRAQSCMEAPKACRWPLRRQELISAESPARDAADLADRTSLRSYAARV
jgi:hypothetical protein